MSTRFQGPIFNKAKGEGDPRQWFSNMPMWNDPDYVSDMNDFIHAQDYNTTNYTLTLVGSGTAAVGTTTNANGLLTLTTGASSSDSDALQSKQINYKMEAAKPFYAEWKAQVSNVATVDLMIGLASSDTTPLDAIDRVVFRMTTGSGLLGYEVVSSAASSTTGSTGVTLVASTDYVLGFEWDGNNRIKFYVNRQVVATVSTNIPTAAMGETYHIKTNSANARAAIIDYFSICKQR